MFVDNIWIEQRQLKTNREINPWKTKTMVIENDKAAHNINLNEQLLKQVDNIIITKAQP